MASSLVDVYNLALDAIGARSSISVPTESSREAEVCNRWYVSVLEQVLASARWPEATKYDYLALLDEQEDDTWELGEAKPGYRYSYSLPSDCLRPQFLSNFSRFETAINSLDQRILNTSQESALLVYTKRQEIIGAWSSSLKMAIIYGLAANICMPLTGKPSRAKVLLEQANSLVLGARVEAANTNNVQYDSLPDWITARGFADTSATLRYYYPYGALLSLPNVS